MNELLLNISSRIKRLLPAQPCVLCGDMSHAGLWCEACDQTLPYFNQPHCPLCALPAPQGQVCGQCLAHPPLFDQTTAAFSYSFPIDKLIQAMKYGEQLALADRFATELSRRAAHTDPPDYLIAMPLHPGKLRERGFNQSLLLARKISRELKLKLLPDACQRLRDTPPQSALPWKERAANVRNAFSCNMDLTGKHVVLIDDVLTTGASLNALAGAVKQRGAEKISAWVVARTLLQDTH